MPRMPPTEPQYEPLGRDANAAPSPSRPAPEEERSALALASPIDSPAPLAPTDRALHQTARTKALWGGLYFTHDAQTLVHGDGQGTKLSTWDLQTGICTVVVERSGGVHSSAISPDGTLLCAAAVDGLAMFRFCPRGNSGEGSPPSCESLWDTASSGTAFVDVTFSRDGAMVASARSATGVVEIRDAISGNTIKEIDDFPACAFADQPHGLDFSHDLLAVGGRIAKPNNRQVRLYSIESGFEAITTLELPSGFWRLSFNHVGTKLVVGVCAAAERSDSCAATSRDATLYIYSNENDWSEPTLRLDHPEVFGWQHLPFSLAFSHDDKLLCAGYKPSGSFALWDMDAGVYVRTITQPDSQGGACAFSPADDLLALGGCSAIITLYELLPAEPLQTFVLPGGWEESLSAACTTEEVTMLASGTRVAAIRRGDEKVLFQTYMEEEVSPHGGKMALQPTGKHVAVCMNKAVSVWDVQTGQQLHLLNGWKGDARNVTYSADGSLIIVSGSFTPIVYGAATGDHVQSFKQSTDTEISNAFTDPASTVLVTTSSGAAAVVDLGSGEIMHHLDNSTMSLGGCFDDAGERMAYFLCGKNASGATDLFHNGQLILCDATDGYRELKRITLPTMGASVYTQFSPGEGKYMLLATGGFVPFGVIILDVETGQEPAWSKCLLTMMLPPGENLFGGYDMICWVTLPPHAESDDKSPPPPLILQAAAGTELHFIDVSAFIRSFEKDGNFSLDQLNRLSDSKPEAIPGLLKKWPHVVNLCDPVTGDTLIHHLSGVIDGSVTVTDRRKADLATELWLSGSVPIALLENNEGYSSVWKAATNKRAGVARMALSKLDAHMPLQDCNPDERSSRRG